MELLGIIVMSIVMLAYSVRLFMDIFPNTRFSKWVADKMKEE